MQARRLLLSVILLAAVALAAGRLENGTTAAAPPSSETPNLTWTIQYQAPSGITLRSLNMIDSQTGYVVGGPDWGVQGDPYVLKTTNGGASWTRLNLPGFVAGWQGGIDCLSVAHCLSVGITGQAIRTTDGGASWLPSNMPNGYGGYLYAAYWANTNVVLAGGTNGRSFRSVDAGANWQEFFPGGSVVIWEFQCFASTCYGAGNGASLAYSNDTGANWDRRFAPNYDLLGLSFLDVNSGWVSGQHGAIYYTPNGGLSWTIQLIGYAPDELYYTNFYDIEMLDAQEGWAVGGVNDVAGRIYHTTNGGANWTNEAVPASGFIWEVDFVDPAHGWAVTHDGKILAYGAGGPTATPSPTPTAAGPTATYTPTPTLGPPTATPTVTPTATQTPTATPAPSVTAAAAQVLAGHDDTSQRSTTGYNDLLTLRMGYTNGYHFFNGIRFENLALPFHVRIVDAYLEVYRTYHLGTDPVNLQVYGAALDSTPDFATEPPLSMPQTTAAVPWSVSSEAALDWLASPDLAPVIQEVVDRPGWSAGQALALLIASDPGNSGSFGAVSYEENPANAARLQVSYAVCLPADIDCSCQVAIDDVQAVAAAWGLTNASPEWNRVYDLVADGVIDTADITAAAGSWGQVGCG